VHSGIVNLCNNNKTSFEDYERKITDISNYGQLKSLLYNAVSSCVVVVFVRFCVANHQNNSGSKSPRWTWKFKTFEGSL